MLGLKDFTVFVSFVALLHVHSSHGSEIIGGKEVEPHSMPFMALLDSGCGGTLISPQWVLTAAHCNGTKKVLLGVHSIKKREKKSIQVRNVEKHVPHPSFNRERRVNDLMLFKLNKPVKKTKTVKWLSLSQTVTDPAAGTRCLVAGWGKTDNNKESPMSDVLMAAIVTVIDRKKCNSRFKSRPVITNSMVCASSDGKSETDTCGGDSGGPLLCNGVLVGVTSFGGPVCGDIKHPGVYSFLTQEQLKWINKTMNSPKM